MVVSIVTCCSLGVCQDRFGNRVVAPAFDGSNDSEQFFFRNVIFRREAPYFKDSFGERTCLVEYDRIYLGDGVEIVTSFKQDSLPRSRSDASEISQWNADNQRTGTRDNKKYQRTV